MKPLLTLKTLLLLGLLWGMAPTASVWAQAPGRNPHAVIIMPHDLGNHPDPASLSQLPKVELTPQLLYQVLLAEIAGARSNVALASRTYLELARSTRDPRIAKRATEIALYARQPEAATEAAALWAETDSEAPQAHQVLAGLLLSAQRPDEAAVHLAKVLFLNQAQLPETLMRLNRMLEPYSDKAVILQLTEKLTEPYAGMAEAHWARAQAAANANQDVRALAAIEHAQKLRPDWEQAVMFKAQLQQRSSSKLAQATLSRFLADYPKAREVRFAYARALLGDKAYEAARIEFAKLLEEKPGDPETLYAVGLLSLQLNDLGPAEKYLRQLLDLGTGDPNPLRFYLGQIAENGKRLEEAVQWYLVVTPGEQFLPARARIAALLVQQGRLAEARQSLQQAVSAYPALALQDRAALLIAEAQLLRDAGRFTEAFDLLNLGLANQPEQPELLYEVALLAERLGRNEVLEGNLRKLIQLKPDYAHAYNALGYSLADRNVRLDEAQRLIEKALELAPEDPFIIDSQGWLLYRRGDRNAAHALLNKAWSMRPDPEIAAHLGEVLWMMGRREEAQKIWNEAARANPANELLATTIKKFVP